MATFSSLSFHVTLDDATQFATIYNGVLPVATLQRRRVIGDRSEPRWSMFNTDGKLIAAWYIHRPYNRLAAQAFIAIAKHIGSN